MKKKQSTIQKTAIAMAVGLMGLIVAGQASAEEDDQRKIIVEGFEARQPSMSIGLTAGSLSLGDDKLDSEGVARLGGVMFNWRWDPVEWGGLELGLGAYGRLSENELVNEQKAIFNVAWLWYFARHYHHRFYAVTGLSFQATHLEIGEVEPYEYAESGLMLGLGSEWLINRSWMVNMDVRAVFLSHDQDEEGEEEVVRSFQGPDGSPRQPYPVEWTAPPQERSGLMLNFGIAYRW